MLDTLAAGCPDPAWSSGGQVGQRTQCSRAIGQFLAAVPYLLRGRSSLSAGFGHLDVSALVRPLSRRVVRGSQMSAILAVPVPIEVMAMARAGGADGC